MEDISQGDPGEGFLRIGQSESNSLFEGEILLGLDRIIG